AYHFYIFGAQALDQSAITRSHNDGCFSANILVVYASSRPFPLIVYMGTFTCGLCCFPLDNEPYRPLSDSQEKVIGIRSLTEFGNPIRAPSSISALPPILRALEASPKAISERTSYLRVRLAFHPYPHLIPAFFNI